MRYGVCFWAGKLFATRYLFVMLEAFLLCVAWFFGVRALYFSVLMGKLKQW